VEHFFVTGADPQVNEIGPYSGTPVTVVTLGEELIKKELDFIQNKPRLRISPKTRSRVQRAEGFRKYVHSRADSPPLISTAFFLCFDRTPLDKLRYNSSLVAGQEVSGLNFSKCCTIGADVCGCG
jgi:hypothetical protein